MGSSAYPQNLNFINHSLRSQSSFFIYGEAEKKWQRTTPDLFHITCTGDS